MSASRVYVRAVIGGVWGIFRVGDRKPYMTSATKEGAIQRAYEMGDKVLVLNAYGKVIEEAPMSAGTLQEDVREALDEARGMLSAEKRAAYWPSSLRVARALLADHDRADRLEQRLAEQEIEIRRLREGWDGWQQQALNAEQRLARAVYLAEHLFQMVPQSVWRDSGGDDGQGHYEGDYWAESMRQELKALVAAEPEERT